MNRYALRSGEHLAISGDAIRHDAGGFFLLLGGESPPNERRGSVAIVNVRGALQHHASPLGDSYEAIEARVAEAFAMDPKPSHVVLRIDSPGGLVSGCFEHSRRLRRMSAQAKIPLIAYADELIASAAFAIACACPEIVAPPSASVGSIGVIASLVSVAKHDAQEGVEFRVIFSGKRKADTNPHLPISDDAVRVERARNDELAAQFFDLAAKSRSLPAKKIAALEADVLLGRGAWKAGLTDSTESLDQLIYALDTTRTVPAA